MRLPTIPSLLLLLSACSTTWDPHAPRTITADEEGGYVSVKHGQRLRIPLAGEVAAGYEWRRVEPAIISVIAEGAPDAESFTFTPVRSGNEKLRFEYRPVAGEGLAQRVVSYDVTVP